MSPEEVVGIEHDWLCCDESARVGFFSSAGGGFVPPAYLQDPDGYERAIEAIRGLPPRGTPHEVAAVTAEGKHDWRWMALRGCFAFDADAHGGPYCRRVVPTSPVRLVDLPPDAEVVCRRVRLMGVSFADLTAIDGETLSRVAVQTDFYAGYEGEPQIRIRLREPGRTRVELTVWRGHFDALAHAFQPVDGGWVGIALAYHVDAPWEEQPWWRDPDVRDTAGQVRGALTRCPESADSFGRAWLSLLERAAEDSALAIEIGDR